MNNLQKTLCVIVALELGALGYLWNTRSGEVPLPPANLGLLEPVLAAEIRVLENSFQGRTAREWVGMADVYRTFGLFPQAEYGYQQAVRIAPRDFMALYKWGLCLDLLGETRLASERYRTIIRLAGDAPQHADRVRHCWLHIGENRLREEDEGAAEIALRHALDLPRARLLLARILLRQDRAAEALQVLEPLNRDHPQLVDGNQMRSWAETAAGNPEQAEFYADKTLRSEGLISFWDPLYQEVLGQRDRMGSQAWHVRSLELARAGELETAMHWSRRALEAFWVEDRAQHLAKLLLQAGRLREALAVAEDCIQRVGASAETLDIMGVCWIKLGNDERARQVWERALLFEPTPDLYHKLATLAQRAGDNNRRLYYEGLRQYQTGKDAWIKDDLTAALEHLEQAVQFYPSHSSSWFYLAETQRLQGDFSAARAAYGRCLELEPTHGRALRRLERLERSHPAG